MSTVAAAVPMFPPPAISEMFCEPKVVAPKIFRFVIVALVIEAFEAKKFVEVAFVIEAFVAKIFVDVEFVIVAFVRVALFANKLRKNAFVDDDVVALVVDAKRASVEIEEVALIVPKVAVYAVRFVMTAVIALNIAVKKLVEVEFVIDAFVAKRFVLVEFVIVPFGTFTATSVIFALKLVIVAFVIVAFVPKRFVRVELETVRLLAVEVDIVVVPTIFTTPLAEILILSTGVTEPLGVVHSVSLPGILPAAGVPSTEPRILAPSWKAAPS
jgi:hypothetical protein